MPAVTDAVEVAAPAKINLYLHVVGRRDDGLHCLDSIFAFPALADRLRAEPAEAFSLNLTGPWADALAGESLDRNLALTAARRLAAETGHPGGARLHLDKQIPVAAGIGGGSADAAAALKACRQLWGLDINESRLAAIAADIGADVPPCLAAAPVHAGGVGEQLTPLEGNSPWAVLLVNPRQALATAEVFRRYRADGAPFQEPFADVARWQDTRWLASATGNDLEPPATVLMPEIGEMLARLRALPGVALARMSGSGATCFALFESLSAAERARDRLGQECPGWWVWAGDFTS